MGRTDPGAGPGGPSALHHPESFFGGSERSYQPGLGFVVGPGFPPFSLECSHHATGQTEEAWAAAVAEMSAGDSDASATAQASLVFAQLYREACSKVCGLLRDACHFLGMSPHFRGIAAQFLDALDVLMRIADCPFLFVTPQMLRVEDMLARQRCDILELREHYETFQEGRENTIRTLKSVKSSLKLQLLGQKVEENASIDQEIGLCKSLHKLFFQLLLMLEGFREVIQVFAGRPDKSGNMTPEVTLLHRELLRAVNEVGSGGVELGAPVEGIRERELNTSWFPILSISWYSAKGGIHSLCYLRQHRVAGETGHMTNFSCSEGYQAIWTWKKLFTGVDEDLKNRVRPLRISSLSAQRQEEDSELPTLHATVLRFRNEFEAVGGDKDLFVAELAVFLGELNDEQCTAAESLALCLFSEKEKIREIEELEQKKLEHFEAAPLLLFDPKCEYNQLPALKKTLKQLRQELTCLSFKVYQPNAVFSTISHSKHHVLATLGFQPSVVLLDEASLATVELVTYALGNAGPDVSSIVAVGDPAQTAPYADAPGRARLLLSTSILDGLGLYYPPQQRPPHLALTTSFRMTPDMIRHTNLWYVARGEEPGNAYFPYKKTESILLHLPLLHPHKRMMFVAEDFQEEVPSDTSYYNNAETAMARKIILLLLSTGYPIERIMCLSFYSAQNEKCLEMKKVEGWDGLLVGTEQTGIGKQAGVVIICCTRNVHETKNPDIGFLQQAERWTVASTRAQEACIFVGAYEHLVRAIAHRPRSGAYAISLFLKSLAEDGVVVKNFEKMLDACLALTTKDLPPGQPRHTLQSEEINWPLRNDDGSLVCKDMFPLISWSGPDPESLRNVSANDEEEQEEENEEPNGPQGHGDGGAAPGAQGGGRRSRRSRERHRQAYLQQAALRC